MQARQVAVEDDDVVAVLKRAAQAGLALEGDIDGHPLTPQPDGDRVRQLLVIFDDQYAHCETVWRCAVDAAPRLSMRRRRLQPGNSDRTRVVTGWRLSIGQERAPC